MTVIFVLMMFATFIGIDYVRNRKQAPAGALNEAAAAEPEQLDAVVEGFHVPERMRFHTGHTWVLREREHLARVGVDEFGAALLGGVDRIEAPKPGHWLRQGQKAWSFFRKGEKVDVVSPVEGEVVELNTELLKNPAMLRKEPYGKGWLAAVHVPDEENVMRNLLPVRLVKEWIRESAEKLFAKQQLVAGPVMADGGRPIGNMTDAIPGTSWKELAQEFFLNA